MAKTFNRAVKLCGESVKPGSTTQVDVQEYDGSDNVLKCSGTSVPSSEAGYSKGCLFIKTDASNGTKSVYENIGTTSSCNFNLVGDATVGEITLAEGSVIVGNASGVGVALNAKTTTNILVGNGTTITSVALSGDATMTNAGVVTVSKATGNFGVEAGKIALNLSGGAASASGLLMGVGTTADPATTSTADAKFVELRCETTAATGDNRLMYLRYAIGGAAGGECVRAFTKLEAASSTVRGAHLSLDVASGGSASGLGVGVDSQILVHNGALAGGTYAVSNLEIYSAGASTSVAGVTKMSFIRLVAGGDSTGAANVDDNAFAMDFSGLVAGSGNIIDTDKTTHTAYGGLKINVPGVGTRWLAIVSA